MLDKFTPRDIDRFWRKVDRSGGPDSCWPWLAGRSPRGYGKFTAHHNGKAFDLRANRVAYVLAYGPIHPKEPVIRHTCDNPPCCNPRHLVAGTHQDNCDDRMIRGRWRGHIKLTEDQVREIRARYRPRVVTLPMLAREFGVAQVTIQKIVNRKLWPKVE